MNLEELAVGQRVVVTNPEGEEEYRLGEHGQVTHISIVGAETLVTVHFDKDPENSADFHPEELSPEEDS